MIKTRHFASLGFKAEIDNRFLFLLMEEQKSNNHFSVFVNLDAVSRQFEILQNLKVIFDDNVKARGKAKVFF